MQGLTPHGHPGDAADRVPCGRNVEMAGVIEDPATICARRRTAGAASASLTEGAS
jgi:hypothetical protein